ncbi:MAG TPA: hypothetical protein VK787_13925 [Puia sp.]|jgi:hypothetical protein|nr:hypothetical protein [Puia sp.]
MKWVFFSLLMLSVPSISFSQTDPGLLKLKSFAIKYFPRGYDSSLNYINLQPSGNLHYLAPLYQLFKQENKFKSLFGNDYNTQLSEAVSFTEDYHSALEIEEQGYDAIDEESEKKIKKVIEDLKGVQHVDARRYISFLAKDFKVIMLNEAHAKTLHRAFAISLLEELYKKGFRYLAMEMLNNYPNHSLNKLTINTGYYTAEPIAGELVRRALELGFTLVSYEDTAALAGNHTAKERDSVQAENIYSIIKKNSAAKIFVFAGYGHIAEKTTDADFIPMAMKFKKISGINPLTVDQTDMTEGSNFGYANALYKAYTQKYFFTNPSIAVMNNQPVNISNNDVYDISVIHPPTIYRDGRPDWLSLYGLRQPVYINPNVKDVFLVQAYYQKEADQYGPGQIVPADQSYIPTNKGNYLLYLRKGKYIIIYRSLGYHLIGKLKIDVE